MDIVDIRLWLCDVIGVGIGQRLYLYDFGTLEGIRMSFEESLPLPVNWDLSVYFSPFIPSPINLVMIISNLI